MYIDGREVREKTKLKGDMIMQTKEEKIISNAVTKAIKRHRGSITRHDAAEDAAIIANRRGVNVASAPYLQNIFMAALDKRESVFKSENDPEICMGCGLPSHPHKSLGPNQMFCKCR